MVCTKTQEDDSHHYQTFSHTLEQKIAENVLRCGHKSRSSELVEKNVSQKFLFGHAVKVLSGVPTLESVQGDLEGVRRKNIYSYRRKTWPAGPPPPHFI